MSGVQMIFLDIDEVLVSWVAGAVKVLGLDYDDVLRQWNAIDPRPWDFLRVVECSSTKLWAAISDAGEQFWVDLPVYPWARELYALCAATATTTLLTSPSRCPTSHSGKAHWIQGHFGETFRDYLIGSVKWTVARPGAVLIDDSPTNCALFREHGGQAILFPGVGNDLRGIHPDKRVEYVAQRLRELQ